MTLIYRPNHPKANENGMVERNLQRRKPGAYVISDTIDGTWHPADGRTYDSKSNFRRATRSRGMVEVGTERQVDKRDFTPHDVKRDIGEAIRKVNEGYKPDTSKHDPYLGNDIKFSGDGWQ